MNHPLLTAIASIALLIGYTDLAKDKSPALKANQQASPPKVKSKGPVQEQQQGPTDKKYAAIIVTAKGDTVIYRAYFVPKKIIH
jgi:hypothetical protein